MLYRLADDGPRGGAVPGDHRDRDQGRAAAVQGKIGLRPIAEKVSADGKTVRRYIEAAQAAVQPTLYLGNREVAVGFARL